jgi:hypothetical protein
VEEPVDDPSGQNELDSPLVGKWTVGNQDAEYGSFEFTADNKYIITQRTTTPSARSASLRASETVYIVIIFGDIASLSNSGNEYTLSVGVWSDHHHDRPRTENGNRYGERRNLYRGKRKRN